MKALEIAAKYKKLEKHLSYLAPVYYKVVQIGANEIRSKK